MGGSEGEGGCAAALVTGHGIVGEEETTMCGAVRKNPVQTTPFLVRFSESTRDS
jgi:hypothetical protein